MANKREKPPTIIMNHSRENTPDAFKKLTKLAKIRAAGKSVAEQVAANMKPKTINTLKTLRGTRR